MASQLFSSLFETVFIVPPLICLKCKFMNAQWQLTSRRVFMQFVVSTSTTRISSAILMIICLFSHSLALFFAISAYGAIIRGHHRFVICSYRLQSECGFQHLLRLR
uniref:Secreted protein n=1 Tax=Echinococcus granulosus TaxID=6210 RepID=A0A068WMZ0_ECHGR|nr:hypothetical protein EgrG_000429100 [Echinococcus granulosus]